MMAIMDWEQLIAAAERVVGRYFDARVRLRVDLVVPDTVTSVVVRVGVQGGGSDIPASFMVKAAHPAWPGAARMLHRDWAATKLLTRLGGESPLCARHYGGDAEVPLIVLEDLGPGVGSPDRLVDGDDPDAAAASLIDYVRAIAALHAQAAGQAEEFDRIRRGLGPIAEPKPVYHDPWSDARQHTDREIATAIAEYRAVLDLVGIGARASVGDEIAEVTRRVEGPGPLTTLCQGDQNGLRHCMLSGNRLRLYDFGVAGYRHALIEGLPHRVTWGCIRRVPAPVRDAMDNAYRDAIGMSTVDFDRAVTDALARWHILHVIHRLPEALIADRPRGAVATLRQQVIAWIDAFANHEQSTRPVLGETAIRLAARLRQLWPPHTHTIPYLPAFAQS